MREERHDILNELALVSSYVQMHKWEEAQQCIEFIAASLQTSTITPHCPMTLG